MSRKDKLEITKKHLLEEYQYMIAGIDIDYDHKTASFDLEKEKDESTSVVLKPVCSEVNGHQVVSMFKRAITSDCSYLGNPLTYALKNIDDWKFKNTEEDILALLYQFIRVAGIIQPHYDTIITFPRVNELVVRFVHGLKKIITSTNQISDWLLSVSTEHVYEGINNWQGIHDDFPDQYDALSKEINGYFSEMDNENNELFSFKYVKNKMLFKYFTQMPKFYDDFYESEAMESAPLINDRNVLLLDSTITGGGTGYSNSSLLLEMYAPKSATITTLFPDL